MEEPHTEHQRYKLINGDSPLNRPPYDALIQNIKTNSRTKLEYMFRSPRINKRMRWD